MKKTEKPEVSFKIDDQEYLRLDDSSELNLDSVIKNLSEFMEKNSGKGETEEVKDKIYKDAQELWNEFRLALTDTKFNLHLNRTEYNLLTNILLTKMEYDADTVFVAIELTNVLGSLKKHKWESDKELVPFKVNPTELTYIYHLISKHTVKGITNTTYNFANILRRIGEVSKLFNFYDNKAKYYSEYIVTWVTSFEDGVTLDSSVEAEEVDSTEVAEEADK